MNETGIVVGVVTELVLVLFVRNSMEIQDLKERLDAATSAIDVMNVAARNYIFVVCDEKPQELGGGCYSHPCDAILTYEQHKRLRAWMAEAAIG
jgi:hypothetical protein